MQFKLVQSIWLRIYPKIQIRLNMIDLFTYRHRIGSFSCKQFRSQNASKSQNRGDKLKDNKIHHSAMIIVVYLMTMLLICQSQQTDDGTVESCFGQFMMKNVLKVSAQACSKCNEYLVLRVLRVKTKSVKVVDINFEAKYLNGNIQNQKGIVNMHLNIRSLRLKVIEVKSLVKEHNPHTFGISEAELCKDIIDEKSLKVPGYNILFQISTSFGLTR